MCTRFTVFLTAASVASLAPIVARGAQPGGSNSNYHQGLVDGSIYRRDYCLAPCACAIAPAEGGLTGTFTMLFNHSDTWTSYFDIVDVDFHASTDRDPEVRYTGTGTYEIGGDFALTQRLILNLTSQLEPGGGTPQYTFDSGTSLVQHFAFPAIDLTAQTEVMGCTQRSLSLHTAATPVCVADVGSAGGATGPDGRLDNNDFIAFINLFFDADARADFGSAGGQPGSDGQFNNNDFIAFINRFFDGQTGC